MGSERSSDNWPRLLFLTQSRLRVHFSFPHTNGGEEFRMAPCAFVADLEDFVLSLLEENRRYAYSTGNFIFLINAHQTQSLLYIPSFSFSNACTCKQAATAHLA